MDSITSKLRITFLNLPFILLIIFCNGCEKEEDNAFFEGEFMKFSDFGCETINWHFQPEYTKNYYVINSQSEMDNIFIADCQPNIDFDKYTLIAGIKRFSSGATFLEENIVESSSDIIYTVTFLTDISMVAIGVPYHVIIEENNKKINE